MGEPPLSCALQLADLGSLASQCRTGGERGPCQESCATVCGLSALVITVGTPNCSGHRPSAIERPIGSNCVLDRSLATL